MQGLVPSAVFTVLVLLPLLLLGYSSRSVSVAGAQGRVWGVAVQL